MANSYIHVKQTSNPNQPSPTIIDDLYTLISALDELATNSKAAANPLFPVSADSRWAIYTCCGATVMTVNESPPASCPICLINCTRRTWEALKEGTKTREPLRYASVEIQTDKSGGPAKGVRSARIARFDHSDKEDDSSPTFKYMRPQRSGTAHSPTTLQPRLVRQQAYTIADFDSEITLLFGLVTDYADKERTEIIASLTCSAFFQLTPQSQPMALLGLAGLIFDMALRGYGGAHSYALLARALADFIPLLSGAIKTAGSYRMHFATALLNACEAAFERGWSDDLPYSVNASTLLASGSQALNGRQGRSLIAFIGELFRVQLVSDSIVFDILKRLLDNAKREDIESACLLVHHIGDAMDVPNTRPYLDGQLLRMDRMSKNLNVDKESRQKLQDAVRERRPKWMKCRD